MKTKILGAVAGLAVLAAVAGTGTGSAEAHKYERVRYQPICGYTWVKVFPKKMHHDFYTWKQVWKCGRHPFYY